LPNDLRGFLHQVSRATFLVMPMTIIVSP
jgi:hypothetical protein